MPPVTQSAPSANFASLLASLAAPAHEHAPPWKDDLLADDVATLSYEHALRAHGRNRSPDPGDRTLAERGEPTPFSFPEESVSDGNSGLSAKPKAVSGGLRSPAHERNLRSASITIRMSQAECEQLHRRAAEAGLTVSAYLRSCTFEAESLRALVKETMAQLRQSTGERQPALARPPWRQRMSRLLAHWRGGRRNAGA